MGNIVHTLINRRYGEKCIAYAESHDQVVLLSATSYLTVSIDYLHCNKILPTFSSRLSSGIRLWPSG